jgi:glutamine amidotransferase
MKKQKQKVLVGYLERCLKIDNQNNKYKLPHIGWNQINILKDSKIFKDIENNSHMYFVHSYEFVPKIKV